MPWSGGPPPLLAIVAASFILEASFDYKAGVVRGKGDWHGREVLIKLSQMKPVPALRLQSADTRQDPCPIHTFLQTPQPSHLESQKPREEMALLLDQEGWPGETGWGEEIL